jgi:hypothetical protein
VLGHSTDANVDPGAQLIIARSSFKRNDMAALNVVMRVCNSNGAIAAGDVLQLFCKPRRSKRHATVKSLSTTMEVQVVGLRGLVVGKSYDAEANFER